MSTLMYCNLSQLKAQKLKQHTIQKPKHVLVTVLIIVSPRIVGELTGLVSTLTTYRVTEARRLNAKQQFKCIKHFSVHIQR